jgi:threonine synthase
MITYTDTRGMSSQPRSLTEVVLGGIAPGGGLYVPERLPQIQPGDLKILGHVPYHERAASIFGAFETDLSEERIAAVTAAAYGDAFADPAIAPVRPVGDGRFVLELWHGPTLAFKDMALQCMPLFFSEAIDLLAAQGKGAHDFLVLVATSGDTGVAALNGFADRPHTRICVYYPANGVSTIQRLQMVTQPGGNLAVVAVEGDFDACQSSVKAVFDDIAFNDQLATRHHLALSSANSINWGRLLPQIVYYVSAYADMVGGGHVELGAPIDVCVPTGNFGNILAAHYARRMGVPIGRLLCASNANNVLTDFLATGVYDISQRELAKTPSPSMDILISSNLERLLFDLCGDAAAIRRWMADLKSSGRFEVDETTFERLGAGFSGAWVDNATCLQTIGAVQREHGYLLDPHTAVAWQVASDLPGNRPLLIVSTAHWSKFPADVVRGLTSVASDEPLPGGDDELSLLDRVVELAPGASVPPQLRAVREREVRFDKQIAGGREALELDLLEWLGAGR